MNNPLKNTQEILQDFLLYPIRAFPSRHITKATCERYDVRSSISPVDGETIVTRMYPYFKKKKLSGYKERHVADKVFYSKGDCNNVGLFGSHIVPSNGKTLFITEGEEDCLALYQVLKSLSNIPDWEPSVVSLSHGAASAARDISTDLDFVNSFEKVVLVFDQDDAGQDALEDACKILAGKAYTATFSEKDPCEMLKVGKAEELKWAVLKHARLYMPDSIVNYADAWDRYLEGRDQKCYPFPETWTELNYKTYGIRFPELVMVSSGSGSGKSQFIRELQYHFYQTTDFKMADIKLEEDISESMQGLISLHLNKRISLPDVVRNVEDEKER